MTDRLCICLHINVLQIIFRRFGFHQLKSCKIVLQTVLLMIKRIFLAVGILIHFGLIAHAQQFTDVSAELTGVSEGSARWIDHDRDGDLDALVMGEFFKGNQRGVVSNLYNNLRNDRFSRIASGLPNLHRGDFDLGDYNLDGINDIALIGETSDGTRIAAIYRGTVSGQFLPTGISFLPVRDGSIRFGDFDGDGDPDILLTGESKTGPVSLVYRNDRNNTFVLVPSKLQGVRRGVGIWYDHNLDGYPDIFITGADASGHPFSMLYTNQGMGFEEYQAGIIPLKHSYAAVGDYDNDGDPDLLVMGEADQGRLVTRLYRNDRSKGFGRTPAIFVHVSSGFADWGDFDGDGDVDLLISGESAEGPVTRVYENNRARGFSDLPVNLIGLHMSTGQWGDYDMDGDLDILIAGMAAGHQYQTRIYRNDLFLSGQAASDASARKTGEEEDIFNNSVVVPERGKPDFLFVYSSAYTDLYNTGTKAYFLFVSPVKRPKKQYEMEDRYSQLLREQYPQWSIVDQGNLLSIGKPSQAEAEKSRKRIIDEYTGKNFTIIEINW